MGPQNTGQLHSRGRHEGRQAHASFQEEARQRTREDSQPWRCKEGSSQVRTPARVEYPSLDGSTGLVLASNGSR